MSRPPRRQLPQTISGLPDRKREKARPPPVTGSSFLSTFFATLTSTGQTAGGTQSLKTHRSEAELRKDYLSPEREKEIGEIWEMFKRQSQDVEEDKLTSFPCIVEYEYEYDDTEEDNRESGSGSLRTIKT
jgi:hypothetical protein